ncbi:MAG: 4Fe-4S ferredoxin, iron-sulfur binding protein [Deltaproteobacteria bacterium]|nr:4Fe-4S ferredoxin, iron-sulfur binding protein [Deltaproteobacteria bacterium]
MRTGEKAKNAAIWIETVIKDFINQSPENTLKNAARDKAWADPLVGFSGGADPLYQEYKRDIGDFFLTPLEFFGQTFPSLQVSPEQLTVISWILPQTDQTKADLRRETVHPSESWARARIFGEEVNVKLRRHMVETLTRAGIEAVAPMLSPLWGWKMSEKYGFASTWSERHAAYAAGLGTFGLCDGLITPVGKAMRCGSVIANVRVPPSNRPYQDHHAYCLFYTKGTCGKCIPRCPAGALTKEGHDKGKCKSYVDLTAQYVKENFKFEGYGCGFCQTGVPCESKIPLKESDK